MKVDLDEYCSELETKLEDKYETEKLLRLASYASLGLSAINVAVLLFIGIMLFKGVV